MSQIRHLMHLHFVRPSLRRQHWFFTSFNYQSRFLQSRLTIGVLQRKTIFRNRVHVLHLKLTNLLRISEHYRQGGTDNSLQPLENLSHFEASGGEQARNYKTKAHRWLVKAIPYNGSGHFGSTGVSAFGSTLSGSSVLARYTMTNLGVSCMFLVAMHNATYTLNLIIILLF